MRDTRLRIFLEGIVRLRNFQGGIVKVAVASTILAEH